MATVGTRSKKCLDSVHPTLRDVVTEALLAAPPWLDFAVISGLRTAREQAALYSQGRDEHGNVVHPEKVVTHRDGVLKKSNHQAQADGEGHAIDIAAYENGKLTWDEAETAARAGYIVGFAASRGIKLAGGLKWDWDLGHIELVTS